MKQQSQNLFISLAFVTLNVTRVFKYGSVSPALPHRTTENQQVIKKQQRGENTKPPPLCSPHFVSIKCLQQVICYNFYDQTVLTFGQRMLLNAERIKT